jgi:uncharacterized membrane protein
VVKSPRRCVTDSVTDRPPSPLLLDKRPPKWITPAWEVFHRPVNRVEYMREYMRKRRYLEHVTDVVNTCLFCGAELIGQRKAKTCSQRCRVALHRRHHVTLPVNTGAVTLPVNSLAVAWRYRMAGNYAAGALISKTGSIDRASVETSLKERFGREVIELEPRT